MSGLRIVLGAFAIPGPWPETCKGMYYCKGLNEPRYEARTSTRLTRNLGWRHPPGTAAVLQVVDDLGEVVADAAGHLLLATIADADVAAGAASVRLTLGPYPGGRDLDLALVPLGVPDADAVRVLVTIIELVGGSGIGGSFAQVEVGLCAVANARDRAMCPELIKGVPPTPLLVTGEPQEIATLVEPGGGSRLHIVVQGRLESVPEPTAAAMLGMGLLGLCAIRRSLA